MSDLWPSRLRRIQFSVLLLLLLVTLTASLIAWRKTAHQLHELERPEKKERLQDDLSRAYYLPGQKGKIQQELDALER